MPAVRSASDCRRASRSWNDTLRRATYSTAAKMARVSPIAVVYQTVSRPRIVSTSFLHHVAHATHGVDQLGATAAVDLLAQPGDHHVHDVGPGIEVIVPRILGDQRTRHHASLVPDE